MMKFTNGEENASSLLAFIEVESLPSIVFYTRDSFSKVFAGSLTVNECNRKDAAVPVCEGREVCREVDIAAGEGFGP